VPAAELHIPGAAGSLLCIHCDPKKHYPRNTIQVGGKHYSCVVTNPEGYE